MQETSIWQRLLKPFKEAIKGKITDTILGYLIEVFIEIHSQELDALLRIESKVNALVNGPFNSGCVYLTLASKPQRTIDERKKYLNIALGKFIDAQSQQKGYDQAVAQLYVALCFIILGQVEDGSEWLEKAFDTADKDINIALRVAQDKADKFLAKLFGAGAASREFVKVITKNDSLLRAIGPLLNKRTDLQYWRVEDDEWEELVGGTSEPGESPWVKKYSKLNVYRGGTLVAILPDRFNYP